MKISNSKKQLAKIIHENGGWPRDAEYSAQDGSDGQVSFYKSGAPVYNKLSKIWNAPGSCVHMYGSRIEGLGCVGVIKNFHQTILSRDEYFHLYPAPDADGWIAFNGCNKPDFGDLVVEVMLRDGEVSGDGPQEVDYWDWSIDGSPGDIISYRRHKPEIAPAAQEPKLVPVPDDKPTIEQLAADYRNRKDYADREQQEADAAKADAEAKLAELVAAGKALGLVLSVAEPEPELGITDWRDLLVGDEVECVRTPYGASCTPGMFGVVTEVTAGGVRARFDASLSGRADGSWFSTQGGGFRFIRRPAKGAANA